MARPTSEALVRRLVREVPSLETALRAHLDFTDGEILSHPFFADLTRQVQSWAGGPSRRRQRDVRRILEVLEEEHGSGDIDVVSLIALSFVEVLEPQEKGYQEVRAMMGPLLRAELARYEKR